MPTLASLANWDPVPLDIPCPAEEFIYSDHTVPDLSADLVGGDLFGEINFDTVFDALKDEPISVDELESMVAPFDADDLTSGPEIDMTYEEDANLDSIAMDMIINILTSKENEQLRENVVNELKSIKTEPVEETVLAFGSTKEPHGMPTPPLSPDCVTVKEEPDSDYSSKYSQDEDDEDDDDDNDYNNTLNYSVYSDYDTLRITEWNAQSSEPSDAYYKEAILHDCMWNGLCKETGCPRNVTETPPTNQNDLAVDDKKKTDPRLTRVDFGVACNANERASSLDQEPLSTILFGGLMPESQETQHVVAAYPLSDHSYHANRIIPEASPTVTIVPNQWEKSMGLETPSDSEEEEIDVVSLPVKCQVQNPVAKTKVVNVVNSTNQMAYKQKLQMAVMVAAGKTPQKRGRKRIPKLTLKRVSTGRENVYQPKQTIKRTLRVRAGVGRPSKQTGYANRTYQRIVPFSPFIAGAGQEKQRRREHNDMERRRRNDLKSNFEALRVSVPYLQPIDRAAKVLILEKSRDWIYEERERERRLIDNKEILRRKNENLRKILEMKRKALGLTG